MDEKRMVIIGVTAVLGVATITILAVSLSSPSPSTVPPPESNYTDFRTLLVISLDGFRADYLQRNLTPTLTTLAREGVHAPYMVPSYPSLTFPNHYSIITGLHPEDHGIIANYFKDPETGKEFEPNTIEQGWFGGEPIWVTLNKTGKRSASYMWPFNGCNINNVTLDDVYTWDDAHTITFKERVNTVLEWLSRPLEERPHMITLYFEEPDHLAHDVGPQDPQVNEKLKEMDAVIAQLVVGLQDLDLTDTVNLIILADHGMAEAGKDKVVNLNDYLANLTTLANYTYGGAFSRIKLVDPTTTLLSTLTDLNTCHNNLLAYGKDDMPKRYHFNNNPRIEDVVIVLTEGYVTITKVNPNKTILMGQHGYDPYYQSMHPMFIASGPDFMSGVTLEPFHNTELYHLMCHLTGVDPAPNSGTPGSLNAALIDPVPEPELPQVDQPPSVSYPVDTVPENNWNMSECQGDSKEDGVWMKEALTFTKEEIDAQLSLHLPWGLPLTDNLTSDLDLILLHHHDHVTAYSNVIKAPLWTSFTLEQRPIGTPLANWSSDVRLTKETSPSCLQYEDIDQNYTMAPLFPPEMSTNSSLDHAPYLASNAVPVSDDLSTRWATLMGLIRPGIFAGRAVNVILGPVFKTYNISSGFPVVPSHLFAVATWCGVKGIEMTQCDPNNLFAVGFLYPEDMVVWNDCLNDVEFSVQFSNRVKDVELATGLTLYPTLKQRTQLVLQANKPSWPLGE